MILQSKLRKMKEKEYVTTRNRKGTEGICLEYSWSELKQEARFCEETKKSFVFF